MKKARRGYALIIEGSRVLVVRNRRGRWTLPGGRANRGEPMREAVKREVREEIGVRVKLDTKIGDRHMRHHAAPCDRCVVYLGKIKKGKPKPRAEIVKYQWVTIDKAPKKLSRFRTRRMRKALSALR